MTLETSDVLSPVFERARPTKEWNDTTPLAELGVDLQDILWAISSVYHINISPKKLNYGKTTFQDLCDFVTNRISQLHDSNSSFTSEQIQEGLKQILCDSLNADTRFIQPDSELAEDLGAESIDFMDVSMRVDSKFKIDISGRELFEGLTYMRHATVAKLRELITEKLS